MEKIAAWGRGRFYYTDDPENIPRIFISETMVVSRDLFVEEDTRPTLVYPGEMLEGFGPESFPPFGGYLRTFAKPAAQVLLSAREQDPLLVSWRYGLGKSVAFTSDLAGRWGQQWVGWSEFPRFVSQMARWTMRRSGAGASFQYQVPVVTTSTSAARRGRCEWARKPSDWRYPTPQSTSAWAWTESICATSRPRPAAACCR